MSIDLSAATSKTLTGEFNPINTPKSPGVTTTIAIPDWIKASWFHAGSVDFAQPNISGINGVGLNQYGLYGVDNGTPVFLLAANNFENDDWGVTNVGEVRFGDNVKRTSATELAGDHYVWFDKSTIKFHGVDIILSTSNYVWVGNPPDDGDGIITGCGIGDMGLAGYKYDSVPTFILSAGAISDGYWDTVAGEFRAGDNTTADGVDSTHVDYSNNLIRFKPESSAGAGDGLFQVRIDGNDLNFDPSTSTGVLYYQTEDIHLASWTIGLLDGTTLADTDVVATLDYTKATISQYLGNFTDLATALADSIVQASYIGQWFTTDDSESYFVSSNNPTLVTHVTKIKANASVGSLDNIDATSILGNITASAGPVTELTYTEIRTALDVAEGADVTVTSLSNAIHTQPTKATPVDADEFALVDTADSNGVKTLTWANLKSTLVKGDVGLGDVPNTDCTNASNITTGTLPSSVIPPVAMTTVQVAASESTMLSLTTEEGDVVVRSDENKSYMHNGGSAGTIADFTELSTPTDSVLSVNGETGTVVLTTSLINDSTDKRYVTDAYLTVLGNTTGSNSGDVTVVDSSEIDFTLTGQSLTASIISGSIDESKLDTSVNASLDLADTALQSIVEDTTPQLGGHLGGQNLYYVNNLTGVEINNSSGALVLDTGTYLGQWHTDSKAGIVINRTISTAGASQNERHGLLVSVTDNDTSSNTTTTQNYLTNGIRVACGTISTTGYKDYVGIWSQGFARTASTATARGCSGFAGSANQYGYGVATNEFWANNPTGGIGQAEQLCGCMGIVNPSVGPWNTSGSGQYDCFGGENKGSYEASAVLRGTGSFYSGIDFTGITYNATSGAAIRMAHSTKGSIIEYDANDYTMFASDTYSFVIGGTSQFSISASAITLGSTLNLNGNKITTSGTLYIGNTVPTSIDLVPVANGTINLGNTYPAAINILHRSTSTGNTKIGNTGYYGEVGLYGDIIGLYGTNNWIGASGQKVGFLGKPPAGIQSMSTGYEYIYAYNNDATTIAQLSADVQRLSFYVNDLMLMLYNYGLSSNYPYLRDRT